MIICIYVHTTNDTLIGGLLSSCNSSPSLKISVKSAYFQSNENLGSVKDLLNKINTSLLIWCLTFIKILENILSDKSFVYFNYLHCT